MSNQYGPYARTGVPGGPGCDVATLEITTESPDGTLTPMYLLDAGECSEVEMLRTVAQFFGAQWGHDDLGWWATIPRLGGN